MTFERDSERRFVVRVWRESTDEGWYAVAEAMPPTPLVHEREGRTWAVESASGETDVAAARLAVERLLARGLEPIEGGKA